MAALSDEIEAQWQAAYAAPEWEPGAPYQVCVPGGFTLFGYFVKPLQMGRIRLMNVRCLMGTNAAELPAMTEAGTQKTMTTSQWRVLDVTPILASRDWSRPSLPVREWE
jgi:hypothetical protein